MKEYFVEYSCGAGMSNCEVISEKSLDIAEEVVREICIEWALSFGFEQDEDHFGELDSVGKDWNEEEGFYEDEGFLEYFAEEYDTEKHDDHL